MLNTETQHHILARLTHESCLLQAYLLPEIELKCFKYYQLRWGIKGKVTIAGQELTLCVGGNDNFPLCLPMIFLCPSDALGFIPHVGEDGYICYLESEGLLLNSEDPAGIIGDAITKAVDVLYAGIIGRNSLDFMNEFGAYWQQISSQKMYIFSSVDNVLSKVYIHTDNEGLNLVADQISTVKSYFYKALDLLTRRKALYIPLQESTFILPPTLNNFWSVQEIKRIIWQNLSLENHQRLKSLGKKWKSQELVILGLPRPRGGTILIGISFSGVTGGHPLLSGRVSNPAVPIQIKRYDRDYLLNRGGGQTKLDKSRILVVGCGAVGGIVTLALAQTGIRYLTLVDPDILQIENIFRHILGKKALYQPKVTALKEEIESKYPYISVTTHQNYIQELIQKELIHLSRFDLAIFATGNHTVELYINDLLHQQSQSPITIFTWLEPYGIGGHALLTHPNNPGCFRCLFNSKTTDTPFRNQSAFAAYGQSFSRDDLGCGNLYMPYSALDAQKTAMLAVQLALDGLTGSELGNPILSWKGNNENFIAAGFQVSPRYKQGSEELHANRYAYINSQCPVCGEQRR